MSTFTAAEHAQALFEILPHEVLVELTVRMSQAYPGLIQAKVPPSLDGEIAHCVTIICEVYHVKPTEVRSGLKRDTVRRARATIIHLLNNPLILGASRVAIGRVAFRSQDNSTMIYHEKQYLRYDADYVKAAQAVCAFKGVDYDIFRASNL